MSVLELLGSVLTELEKVQEKLDRLLAVGSARQTEKPKMTDDEIMLFNEEIMAKVNKREVQPLNDSEPNEEEGIMDLSKVVLLKETSKAFLAFKKNMQVWVAKSHLEGEYDLGNTYDLKVKEKSKWILDKLDWKPFTVVKG